MGNEETIGKLELGKVELLYRTSKQAGTSMAGPDGT